MKQWLARLGVIAMAVSAFGQMDNVTVTTTKVTDSIYMLQARGGNIGVSIGDDGVFMIDDQFAPLTNKITAAIAELTDQPIRFVINTHWHGDHTGGNENLGKQGVTIVAHDNVRKRMNVEQVMKEINNTVPASPEAALPVITFNDRMTFHLNDDEIRVLHKPRSHTDGDSILYFVKDNVIHAGDIVFNGSYPFIDTSSGGSYGGLVKTIEDLLTIGDADTKIIPGHGPLASKEDIQVYLDMLKDVRSRLEKFIEKKTPLAKVEVQNPLKDYNEKWGNGFMKPDVWLRIVYADLARQ